MHLCTCQGKGVGRQSPLVGPALSPVLSLHLYENLSVVQSLFPAGTQGNEISNSKRMSKCLKVGVTFLCIYLEIRETLKHV